MSTRPQLFTRGLSGLSQPQTGDAQSPAEQRDDAKRNFLKTMRALPTQHYWNVYFDRQSKEHNPQDGEYNVTLEQLGTQIGSVQDFWRYSNNTPVDQIKMRESLYLFKQGFKPVWEDRRNISGGSWTFRMPKTTGPDFFTHVQMLAIGEKLESVIDENDQLCGVGLSVRFNSHLITVWHRDSSKQNSIDGMLACILEDIPAELRPKPENYFYKRHRDHAGFKAPPELQAVLDSQDRATKGQTTASAVSPVDESQARPAVTIDPPSTQ